MFAQQASPSYLQNPTSVMMEQWSSVTEGPYLTIKTFLRIRKSFNVKNRNFWISFFFLPRPTCHTWLSINYLLLRCQILCSLGHISLSSHLRMFVQTLLDASAKKRPFEIYGNMKVMPRQVMNHSRPEESSEKKRTHQLLFLKFCSCFKEEKLS